MSQVLIRSGRLFDPSTGLDEPSDVLIKEGYVTAIGSNLDEDGAEIVEAAGCIVTPGLIDLHAHLREPGFEQKGTIQTETEAALQGGFTTVCAMPNTDPTPDNAPAVEGLLKRIAQDAQVRVFPVGSTTVGRSGKKLSALSELADTGCVAVTDDGSPVASSSLMRNALNLAGSVGMVVAEHCDEPGLSGNGTMHEGAISELLGLAGQPDAAETASIARNIELCELTGGRLHIMHVTTARGVEQVQRAKERGLPITSEVTPSHLFLTDEAVAGGDLTPAYNTSAKINPPLRTEEDRLALLAGVNAGVIDAIATDHAPHAPEEKQCEFDLAPFGISCAETALATVTTLVARGELHLAPALRSLTQGPAEVFALQRHVPGIGTLKIGAPGDVTVFDPEEIWTVNPSQFASKGHNTPLAGIELQGRVRAVIVEGTVKHMREAPDA
ncbi:MAG: dihydroorotase [Dehalococcoidia bacterium]|nr:dihydroorotase [Dehalococcoidia bacterium]|tara:strand:+ start:8672 stop:9994 length:1323 start_codon:yes stop_codon:yes gene_type:complete